MAFKKNYTYFENREQRAAFIAKTFATELAQSKRILDVGCDYNTLKKIVGDKVLGVDLYGAPDIKIDFEKEQLRQFRDQEFDFVVCTEVLEHLDNLHAMTAELLRVSKRYVLVSLPNSHSIFTKWNILFHGHAGKFYGLPLDQPEDRHRWFFSYNDVDRFFRATCDREPFRMNRKFLHINFGRTWRGELLKNLVRVFQIDNACQSYWILLERTQHEA